METLEGDDAGREGDLPRPARFFDAAFVVTSGLVLLAMMLMTLFDVVGRYFFNAPLGFAFEMTQIGMAVMVFCALPSVTLRGTHVTVGLFEQLFVGRLALVRDLLWLAVIAASCGALAWKLSGLAQRFLRYGDRTSVLHLHTGWIAWLGVVCLALSALAAVYLAICRLRER
ncbi:TRAP transporter small permease [Jiella pelagia]|uniref:TRAP transporter small permease protein n=1 Tax=Jiella pelagia TaxID=2986949 RepID=A0ABY7C1B3_9HYPH|nr:TRAP transporter small permease [Jiella pelagia]WAP69798.1 TRAP transporter small permease [Jiella pelagia]